MTCRHTPWAATSSAAWRRRPVAPAVRLPDNGAMQDIAFDPPRKVFDFVIAGGGVAGLSLAAALKQALGRGAEVLVVDPAMGEREGRDRASAIASGSRRMFERIGAWEAIAPLAQPIRQMAVTDGRVRDAVRPAQMHFDECDGEPLAHMAMNDDVVASLSDLCGRLGVVRLKGLLAGFAPGRHSLEATMSGKGAVRARLLIGADGARSRVRAFAEIATIGWDYGQSAIVATIAHEREHYGRAEQHFLPGGPFAILPLPGRRSSIVWSEESGEAKALIAMAPDAFRRELEYRFMHRLGPIEPATPPRAFPLGFRIARRFVGPRLALVGDAAHLVHPLAGQGLNLGLRDVAALAEAVVAPMRLGLDPGAPEILAAFERARRFDVAASGLSMDAMNRLFSNDVALVRALRDFGLRLVDRAPPLKRLLIEEAGGARGASPRLMRGLAI
jgi:2-octaprenyl-6-methoxyphenol hydroxylase